jgi:hypothetical protein
MKTNEEYRLLEQQLAEAQKQIVMLRNALKEWQRAEGDYGLIQADKAIAKALAATQDLSGLVLCDAEPVGVIDEDDYARWGDIYADADVGLGTPLYKARKQP